MRSTICRLSQCFHLYLFVLIAGALVGAGCGAAMARAQTFDATNLHGPVDMAAKWLIQAGDNPAWAEPGFDDSKWTPFDTSTSVKNVFTTNHPEVVWYRLHVKVVPSETGLALAEWNTSSAFDIFVNGERLIHSGEVAPFVPYTQNGRLVKRIPDQQIATGNLLIALRVHISKTEWGSTGPGFFSSNLTLGQESALDDHVWLSVIGQNALNWVSKFSGLGLGIVALALFAAQRQQKEYLWIFLQFLCLAAAFPLDVYGYFHNVPANLMLIRPPLGIASLFFQFLMYLAILRIRFSWWLRAFFAVSVVGVVISSAGQTLGSASLLASIAALTPVLILLCVVLPVILVIHWRRGNGEAGILLIPAILTSLVIYVQITLGILAQIPALLALAGRAANAFFNFHAGPILLDFQEITTLLYILSLAIIMILRSTRITRQQAQLEAEMAAAREVQQVILPDQMEKMPGYQIESIYQPAQEVGGDFFQIIAHKSDASLLIVAGDVVGKGLKAGMLVALLVGAIRSSAETTEEPLKLLEALNRRLMGRGDAQATCLAMRISSDGSVTLANAGHIAPYLNGEPVNVEGSLPLGMIEDAKFSELKFSLSGHDRLMLMSDGIVEARDTEGKLFGFGRVHELLSTSCSAAEVALAAKQFGQEDDISVISVTRTEELNAAIA
jgi:hypothetical protein